ncbi:MAG: Hint domain-containing protein [Pseudomonadota bacterium]
METGFRGTFVISWSQTQTDGETAAIPSALAASKTWRWTGDVVRVDGPGAILRLDGANGDAELRRRAAERVRRLVGAARANTADLEDVDLADFAPLRDDCFVVTDGRAAYVVTLVDVPGARPLAMFVDDVPPADIDLWIVEARIAPALDRAVCTAPEAGRMICFTPGTQIRLGDGAADVAALKPGDRVQTKDNGLQEVLWVGSRRITGARLHVMPELAPVRLRSAALGSGRPDAELVVSPEHRMLVKGAQARALFNSEEVLVSARDLADGQGVWIDRLVREVTYVHVLFERHEIVFANGLETESFHPAQAALTEAQAEAVRSFSTREEAARRVLSKSEAAILGHAA